MACLAFRFPHLRRARWSSHGPYPNKKVAAATGPLPSPHSPQLKVKSIASFQSSHPTPAREIPRIETKSACRWWWHHLAKEQR